VKSHSNDEQLVFCDIEGCKTKLRVKGHNTTQMIHHLTAHHGMCPPQKKARIQDPITDANDIEDSVPESITKEEQDIIDSNLAKFIASSHSSIALVENEDFIEFITSLNPTYKLPSRTLLRDFILKEAEIVKKEARRIAQKNGNFSFCIDLWKSKARDYYVSVTVHFINDDWKLINFPIAFHKIVGSHTAEAIGYLVGDLLSSYLGKGAFPFAGVVDGGDISSVKHTSKKLNCPSPIKDETCICHQMNNIIKRMVIDYLEEHYLNDWRTFIKRIHKSNPFSEEWDRCCNILYNEKKYLQIDTPTRWSSTVSMLEKAVNVKEAVLTMHSQLSTKKDEEKDAVPNWGDSNSEAWIILGQVVELFKPTVEAISRLEGQRYVTQSLILLELCLIENTIKEMQKKYNASQHNQLYVIMKDLQESINELWDRLPVDTVIASILDPRTKFFERIPQQEIDEALKILKKEYHALELTKEDESKIQAEKERNPFESILSTKVGGTRNKSSKNNKWKEELELFKKEDRLSFSSDPLLWWKLNEPRLPGLAKLAKQYLSIPASQASCERLFSVARNDITDKRTSMKPDLVEALIFIARRKDLNSD
jgi:hypothetical protein